jgi:hypothetical protein
MRLALLMATELRHELHDKGARPAAARSRLMSTCWVEPIAIAAAACDAGGAGGAGGAG